MSKLFHLLLFILVLSYSPIAQSQIEVTANELESIFEPGYSFISKSADAQLINLGQNGGPNVYDFSEIAFPDSDIFINYLISSIPVLASRFPGNAVIFGRSPEEIRGNPVFLLGADSLLQLGVVSLDSTPTISHTIPPIIVSIFPIIYGTSFTVSFEQWDTTFNNNWTVFATNHTPLATYSVNVHGFGTIKVGGYQFDCLKIQNGDGSVLYVTKEGLFFVVGIPSTLVDTGMVTTEFMMLMLSHNLTGVEDQFTFPEKYFLNQNYPNPFNPSTKISFNLPERASVDLSIYNALGEKVAVLLRGEKEVGRHSVEWNAAKFGSGIYFYQLTTEKFSSVKKLILLK